MKALHHVILLALFAAWFGGFTFYTAIVVPIGTDVLGSSRTQGFVTQQVTDKLNLIGGPTILMMMIDLIIFRRTRSRKLNTWSAMTLAGIGFLWCVLMVVHPMLDAMLQPEHEHVLDDAKFYSLHRVYLWTSTIQWLLCWVWLVIYVRNLCAKSMCEAMASTRNGKPRLNRVN